MNFSELGRVIEALGKDRGIDKKIVIEAIEQAFLVTARKKFGIQGEYETRYNEDDDDIDRIIDACTEYCAIKMYLGEILSESEKLELPDFDMVENPDTAILVAIIKKLGLADPSPIISKAVNFVSKIPVVGPMLT